MGDRCLVIKNKKSILPRYGFLFNRPLARPRAFCRRFFQARRTSIAEIHGAGHDHVVGDNGFLGRFAVRPRSAGRAQKGKENNQINKHGISQLEMPPGTAVTIWMVFDDF